MSVEEYKRTERTALQRAQAELQRIADKRQEALKAIDARMDLDRTAKEKLRAVVTAGAQREYREAAGRVRKTIEKAQATVRKARRRDEWDSAVEARIAAATARWSPLVSGQNVNVEKVASDLIADALADGDTATLLSLRRELPMAARRAGLDGKVVDHLRERLDMTTPDKTIAEATALDRELSQGLPRLEHTLAAIEYELEGKGDAPVLPAFDGTLSYRLGYSADSEGNVVAPKPPAPDAARADRTDDLQAEYDRLFR